MQNENSLFKGIKIYKDFILKFIAQKVVFNCRKSEDFFQKLLVEVRVDIKREEACMFLKNNEKD